ncbi:hypothetical protein [Pseudoxanthomonas sp. PXM04]|uniref:hypothetical protein n=1 Tax=Pseudoxanthomonas sp. PXM04 TaxID=2769297 RepID=UPI001783EC60|nr:hypothetical protein [Pseudoxanthomonas sp. PXM04]MBD9376161.1 hypothetical protein [Pseudoxanthomonas sp. PXM04]
MSSETKPVSDPGRTALSPVATNVAEMLADLNGGVFLEQVGTAMSDVALGVVNFGDKGKTGEVTLKFKMTRIGESNQIALTHAMAYKRPTSKGKRGEELSGDTPLHVNTGGRLTLMPDTQGKFPFAKSGDEE